jgi:hypothetical protein
MSSLAPDDAEKYRFQSLLDATTELSMVMVGRDWGRLI